MSNPRRILGIDLGGALQRTTGYVVLAGAQRPRIREADLLRRSATAADAEALLLDLIERLRPALIAVDAPLTLPPCLTCPSFCLGPDPERCELRAAQAVWERGGNPATERLCELGLRTEIGGGKPLPTMRIGQIAGRGVALARRLAALRAEWAPVGGPEVLEVYPTASLVRLFPRRRRRSGKAFQRTAIRELGVDISQLGDPTVLDDGHVFDALISAYTGWLSPGGLEKPPPDFNVAAGWIWCPEAR